MKQPKPASEVSLREVTRENLKAVLMLAVHEHQQYFVSSNAISIAIAHYSPERAWVRAIYADEVPVGFVMLDVDETTPRYFLWRFMIDVRYQHRGYGARAMTLIIDHVRARPNATELTTSVVQQPEGGPQPFYEGLGFVPTGEFDEDGEAYLRLAL